MSTDEPDDGNPILYVYFDEKSLSNQKLADRLKTCQSKNDLSYYWDNDTKILMLQGSETAMQHAQEEINSFVGCEAHIYTNEELDDMDNTIQVDPENDCILAIYLFAPNMLEKVSRCANPSQLISEFTLMTAQTHDSQRALENILEDASKSCKIEFIDDLSKSSALLLVQRQDISTLQAQLKDSFATVVMTIAEYEKGLQPWETLKQSAPTLH